MSLTPLYITQLIYIKPGQQDVFDEFERVAIPIITRYSGKLLFRVRPTSDQFVECNFEQPYEIHFVEFSSEEDFRNFLQDEERTRYVHLKEQSIKAVVLIKGEKA